jgi:ferredoxin
VRDDKVFISPSPDEDDLLELVDDRDESSRLSCQLKISAATPDSLTIEVPEG